MTDSYVGDGVTLPKTPEEALELLSGYVGTLDETDEREDLGFAINILANLIRDSADGPEWGDPGDCQDRLDNDHNIFETIGNGFTDEEFTARAIALGLGRHYGDPHCIWCLQAQ